MSLINRENEKTYVDAFFAQASKNNGAVCGDYVEVERSPEATTCILCDGIGSGIKANLAAVMCKARLLELVRLGFTLREACEKVVETMHRAHFEDIPFAAFSVCRILNDGTGVVMAYEMPPPLVLNNFTVSVADQRFYTLGNEVIGETRFHFSPGDAVLMVSDGITQAGMGRVFRTGWSIERCCDFVRECCGEGASLREVPGKVVGKVEELSGPSYGDDATAMLLACRLPQVLNIFTGPPRNKALDRAAAGEFTAAEGRKAVCGSTTAELIARQLGEKVSVKGSSDTYYTPPYYQISGIDLVTEGAITLNQAYNILEDDPREMTEETGVSRLLSELQAADVINFFVGTAQNLCHQDIVFKQMHVLPRAVIVQLLSERLKKMGKQVRVKYF